ncbi:MAG: M20 family metallo-hydrolase [Bacteroidaceae bacterium]|nr:M20 family metallo-hydrolase [Bacteroidaceae bacterium]
MIAIEQLTSEAVELLKRLIATPRTSRNEAEAATLYADYLAAKGFTPCREANNVWVMAPDYDEHRPTLLLNAHLDTVKAVDGWTRDPLTPTIEGDRLYGLGSNDDGASLVALTAAFCHVVKSQVSGFKIQDSGSISERAEGKPSTLNPHPPARPNGTLDHSRNLNLILLASAEEEVSGRDGIERVLPLLPKIDVALVGEPTGMQPAIAEKGLMVLDITAHGRAGHAARNEGDNALYHAIDDINWIRNYQFPKVSPLLGPVKMTATIIQAGTQHNVIPDSCTFTVDVRSNDCYTNQELFETVQAHVQSDVRVRSFRLGSSRIEPGHPLVQSILALGPTVDGLPRQPFGSPTLSDQALMHWPSLKMGPGQSARSHTADEYIRIPELHAAIDDYIQLLKHVRL